MQSLTKSDKTHRSAEALAYLRGILSPGSDVYGEVVHVSRSGMMRHIKLFAVVDGKIQNITWYASWAQGSAPADVSGEWVIKAGGCGMDMVFGEVYSLSRVLFHKEFHCIGHGDPTKYGTACPSNDHSNDRWETDYDAEKAYSPDRIHSDAGYALRYKKL